jgi:GT2 family glycosyltransferase
MSEQQSGDAHPVSVGVVIVNWRNAADTVLCLESLAAATPRPARVVVIDNGSGDGSFDALTLWAVRQSLSFESFDAGVGGPKAHGREWLSIVRAEANRGFAGGNNIGLALLEREPQLTHFLLLNNDAIVAPDYFGEMHQVLAQHPRAGLCTGTIYELADRRRVWYAGGRMLPLRALATHELQRPPTDEPIGTAFVTGCAMVISRAALERVGLLAECYFPGYMEDVEYSWRVLAAGLELVYAPRPVVYHKIGASFGARATSTLTAYHQNRHRLYFVRRNLHGFQRLIAITYMIVTKPGRALLDLLKGRPHIAWATLRGTWAGLTAAPSRLAV